MVNHGCSETIPVLPLLGGHPRVIRVRPFGKFIVPASHGSRAARFQVIKGQINCCPTVMPGSGSRIGHELPKILAGKNTAKSLILSF